MSQSNSNPNGVDEPSPEDLEMSARMLREASDPDFEDEEARQQRVKSNIAAMKDGYFLSFAYSDFIVNRQEATNSIVVNDQETGKQRGGAMSLDHASVLDIFGWLEAKRDLYGGA
jgi:hypothetical protein